MWEKGNSKKYDCLTKLALLSFKSFKKKKNAEHTVSIVKSAVLLSCNSLVHFQKASGKTTTSHAMDCELSNHKMSALVLTWSNYLINIEL